jgi:hypothetical protein
MNATATPSNFPKLNVLSHYTVAGEDRTLIGRRIEGEVFVYDYPGRGTGRPYFVQAGFESKAELAALIADYRKQAERLSACPMCAAGVERLLGLAALA